MNTTTRHKIEYFIKMIFVHFIWFIETKMNQLVDKLMKRNYTKYDVSVLVFIYLRTFCIRNYIKF